MNLRDSIEIPFLASCTCAKATGYGDELAVLGRSFGIFFILRLDWGEDLGDGECGGPMVGVGGWVVG